MIADLKPYPEYNDSGFPWLGELPAHWKTRRAKYFFREVDERSQTGKEVLLSVSHLTGVTPRSEKTITMFLAKSNVGHKLCQPDDVVINTLWAWMAALGVTKHTGIVSPAYGVYRPMADGGLLPQFANQLLRTPCYAAEYLRLSTGVNSSRMRLYPEQFLRIPLVCPPPGEQEAIVRFLAWANGRLERAIRAKQKVIALLNEQKQAIIHRAVTRGLDPSVPLKPSGIPWLGDIPQHWKVRRLKSFAANVTDQTTTMSDDEVYIALENVESWTGLVTPQRRQGEALFTGQVKRFQTNDVLFGKLRPYLAKAITTSSQGVCVGEFFVLRANGSFVCPLFLEQLLRSKIVIDVINSSTFGAKMPRADWQFVGNLRIALPPVTEQETIIKSIRLATQPLANAISRLEREIEFLREYRTRLIADVVTGKLDVREAASQLPDEAPPDTAADSDQVDEPGTVEEEI